MGATIEVIYHDDQWHIMADQALIELCDDLKEARNAVAAFIEYEVWNTKEVI